MNIHPAADQRRSLGQVSSLSATVAAAAAAAVRQRWGNAWP